MRNLLASAVFLIRQIESARRLTLGFRSHLRLSSDLVAYRLLRVMRLPGFNRRRSIKLRDGLVVHYRLNRGDIWAIYEIWMREAYRLPFPVQPGVLVDLGANIGLTSLWYARRLKFDRIIAVEPSPDSAEVASLNFEANGINGSVLRAAVGATDGEAVFCEYNWSTYNGLLFDPVEGPRREPGIKLLRQIKVPVISVATLLGSLPPEARIGLLKLDIEGGEQELLSGDVSWLARVDALIAEFHPPHADVPRLIEVLEGAGLEYRAPTAEFEMHCFVRPAGVDLGDYGRCGEPEKKAIAVDADV